MDAQLISGQPILRHSRIRDPLGGMALLQKKAVGARSRIEMVLCGCKEEYKELPEGQLDPDWLLRKVKTQVTTQTLSNSHEMKHKLGWFELIIQMEKWKGLC